jgi:O-antigen ligase/Flp pilus assembly protein TadD
VPENGTLADPPYRKLVRAAVIAALFLTPLIFPWRIGPGAYSFTSFLVPKEAFVQFTVLLACCCWLVGMVRDGTLRLRSNPLYLPLAVFTALAAVSIAYSSTRYSSAVDFSKMLAVVLFFPIVLHNFPGKKDVRFGLQAIFMSGLVVAALSLIQLSGRLGWVFPRYEGNPQHMYSTFGNDSGVAGCLLPVLPIGIGLFLTNESQRLKWAYFVGVAAVAYAILALQTRGVWLGAFAALVFLAAHMVRRDDLRTMLKSHRRYLTVVLVLAVIFVAVQFEFPGASTDEIDTWTRIKSAFTVDQIGVNHRAVFWGSGLLMAADRPVFGFGLGTYRYHAQRYQGKLMAALGPMSRLEPNELDTLTAHNDYVQVASELGCAGVAVVMWGLFVFWKSVRRTLRLEMDATSRCMLLSSLAGLLGIAVLAVTNFPFHVVTHALVFIFLLAAVATRCGAERAVYKQWRGPNSPFSKVAVSLCIIVAGAAFLRFAMRPHVADYLVASASAMESAEPGTAAALDRVRKAVEMEPRNGRIRALLGQAYLVRGMIDEAKSGFARALEDYDSAWVHIGLGSRCEAHGDFDEAAQHYSDAAFRAPRYLKAHERLIRALMKAGRLEDARKRCEEAFRWVGIVPQLLNVRAELAALEGDMKRCMVLFQRSLEMKPDQDEIRAFLEDRATELQKNISESPSEP